MEVPSVNGLTFHGKILTRNQPDFPMTFHGIFRWFFPYPLVIKHGNGKSPYQWRFLARKITDKSSMFQQAMFDYQRVNQSTVPYLGKLEKFTNLNLAAIKGDNSPYIHHHLWGSVEPREVVIKFTQPYGYRENLEPFWWVDKPKTMINQRLNIDHMMFVSCWILWYL